MRSPSARALFFVLAAGVAPDHAVAAGDRELGQYLSSECVTCHRASGQNAQGIPKITGWPEDQFVAVMNAYKDKQRDNPVMQTIAGRLEAGDIAALAAYFRTQK
ncbi:MAG: c-type cytochrome [Afipia sp.]